MADSQIENLDETILCSDCLDIVLDFFKANDFDPFESEESYVEINESDTDLICDCCQKDIPLSKTYGVITVKDDEIEGVLEKLSSNVGGCEYCEGSERNHLVHVFNDDPWAPESRMEPAEGNTDLGTYLQEEGVPYELLKFLIPYFSCPNCGRGGMNKRADDPDAGVTFSEYTDLYTVDEINQFWGDDFDYVNFSTFLQDYGEYVEKEDLNRFKIYLSKWPMLGYLHPTGEAIYKALKAHFYQQKYTLLNLESGPFYRGRTRPIDEVRTYDLGEMWAPPEGLPGHGRFNSIGVPVLYVTDKIEAIPYEIHPAVNQIVDVAEFNIQIEMKLFDLGSFDPEFQGFFYEKNEDTKNLKIAYLLPNFIGTCCGHIGYNGVKYEGVQSSTIPSYTNYALFTTKESKKLTITKITSYKPKIEILLEEIN